MFDYRDMIFSTNPTYWIEYAYNKIKYKFIDFEVDVAKNKPDTLVIEYLKLNGHVAKMIHNNSYKSKLIINNADYICNNKYKIFGYCDVAVLDNWSKDPIRDFEWPLLNYKKIRSITPTGIDIKYPWELSRLQMLVTLAQAKVLTGDNKYKEKYFEILNNWHESNPIGCGVNWACTMEVAIRAINIIVSASILVENETELNKESKLVQDILYEHMIFIKNNIEYGIVKGNHYLANIIGLKILGKAFRSLKIGYEIYNFSCVKFKEELQHQIYSDGVDHEGSTAYHVLVFELILLGIGLDLTFISKLNQNEITKIDKMANFLRDLCEFSNFPIVGDSDSGRILNLNSNNLGYKSLLEFKRKVFDEKLLINQGYLDEYSLWLLKYPENELNPTEEGKINSESETETETLHEYKHGGFVFFKNENIRLLFRSGTIGLKGKGGHGHNDQLSFVLDVAGDSLFVDPGTFVYTRNLSHRHAFRMTCNHNTVSINNYEQNYIDINKPFRMSNDTKSQTKVSYRDSIAVISSKHKGFKKKIDLVFKRNVAISDRYVEIDDILEGNYLGLCESNFILDTEVKIVKMDTSNILLRTKNGKEIIIHIPSGCQYSTEEVFLSRVYGQKELTNKIIISEQKTKKNNSFRIVVEYIIK